jgi:hypothetical protein
MCRGSFFAAAKNAPEGGLRHRMVLRAREMGADEPPAGAAHLVTRFGYTLDFRAIFV